LFLDILGSFVRVKVSFYIYFKTYLNTQFVYLVADKVCVYTGVYVCVCEYIYIYIYLPAAYICFSCLGVLYSESDEKIVKTAYRSKARVLHPDFGGDRSVRLRACARERERERERVRVRVRVCLCVRVCVQRLSCHRPQALQRWAAFS